ncbi:hypothetical protein ACQEU3_37245 [Spirillospora sp. CA-253888]
MGSASPASRSLLQPGRKTLRPLGLRQVGRSRTRTADHGWWLIVVEFQPSRWSQGSHLNVGTMWLWRDTSHLGFDHGHRVREHVGFRNEAQFAEVADRLTADLPSRPTVWDRYHLGMASALTGRADRARSAFQRMREEPADGRPWLVELQDLATDLEGLVDDRAGFEAWASRTVASCRLRLGLPSLGRDAFPG